MSYLHGSVGAQNWRDIVIRASQMGKGANAPERVDDFPLSGLTTLGFSKNQVDQLFAEEEVPHEWHSGTPLYFHVHWAATTAAAGNVKWKIAYTLLHKEAPPDAIQTVSAAGAAGGLAVQMSTELSAFGAAALKADLIVFRLYRDVDDPEDTYPDTAALLAVGMHYCINGLGSPEKLAQ